MDITGLFPKPHLQTAGRVIDEEAVLILADSSQVNVLNPVGSRIFQLSDGRHTVAEIIQAVTAEYDVTAAVARQDVVEFLQQMVAESVLILANDKEA